MWADGFQTCFEALWILCHRLQRTWTCLPWTAETQAVAASSVAVVQGYLPMQVTLTFIERAGNLNCSTIYELLTEDFIAVWLKLLLEAVAGWAPWGEDCEKTFERWSGCWGKSGRFSGARRGKRVGVSQDMCEDRGKARTGQWQRQGRVLCWPESWPEVVSMVSESAGQAGASLFLPLASLSPPGPSKVQGTQALHSQSTLLWEPHTNSPWSCTEQFPS